MMPILPMLDNIEMMKLTIVNLDMLAKYLYFCDYSIPADKEMLPQMVALLLELHKSGRKMDQWYFKIQECIKNHYRTQGNCFYFKDAKDILMGTKVFDFWAAIRKIPKQHENCVEVPAPFGLKGYL